MRTYQTKTVATGRLEAAGQLQVQRMVSYLSTLGDTAHDQGPDRLKLLSAVSIYRFYFF